MKTISLKTGFDVKVNYFSGAKVRDIHTHLPDLMLKKPDVIFLHVGINNAPTITSNEIVDELLTLKNAITKMHSCKVIISQPTIRSDNGKANLTIRKVNEHLNQIKVETLDNSNVTSKDLGKKGLHLSNIGISKLARNVVEKLGNLDDH